MKRSLCDLWGFKVDRIKRSDIISGTKIYAEAFGRHVSVRIVGCRFKIEFVGGEISRCVPLVIVGDVDLTEQVAKRLNRSGYKKIVCRSTPPPTPHD